MVVSVAASKLETQDLVSVIASSLTGQRFRTCWSVSVSWMCQNLREWRLICCCLPGNRTQTQNWGWSAIASPLQTGDSDRSFCCCPFLSFAGLRLRTRCFCCCLPSNRTQTQNKECLLGRYLYLFPMRRRMQSGASPFPGCNWLFPSEWGDAVWPTLLSSCGTYLHSPNHNQNTFGNVTNTLSPNMMEEDWTVMHALICPSTAEFV